MSLRWMCLRVVDTSVVKNKKIRNAFEMKWIWTKSEMKCYESRFIKNSILDQSETNVIWINPDIDPKNLIKYEFLLQD